MRSGFADAQMNIEKLRFDFSTLAGPGNQSKTWNSLSVQSGFAIFLLHERRYVSKNMLAWEDVYGFASFQAEYRKIVCTSAHNSTSKLQSKSYP